MHNSAGIYREISVQYTIYPYYMLFILVDTHLKTMFYLKKIGILTEELDASTFRRHHSHSLIL